MMRTRNRVGVAVRRDEDGAIVTEGFDLEPPNARWARWPLMRGVSRSASALITGQKSMAIGERLRWEEPSAPARTGSVADEMEEEQEAPGLLGQGRRRRRGPAGRRPPDRPLPHRPGRHRQGGGPHGRRLHRRRRGDPARPAARDAVGLIAFCRRSARSSSTTAPSTRRSPPTRPARRSPPRPPRASAASIPRCGTSFLVVSAVVSIAVYGAVLAITGVFTYPALIATRLIGAPIVTAIAFELQRQAARLSDTRGGASSRCPGMWAQRLTTAPPDREELEVACAALAVALEEPGRRPRPRSASEIPRPTRRRRSTTLSLQSRLRLGHRGARHRP